MSETRRMCCGIVSRSYAPSHDLQPYVDCYWTITSATKLQKPILHRVIPDGCIDIIFDLSAHSYEDAASIVGTMTVPMFSEMKDQLEFMAVRFLPAGAPRFLNGSLHAFTDERSPLEAIGGKDSRLLVDKLLAANNAARRIALIENHLRGCLDRNRTDYSALRGTVSAILERKGNIRVSHLPEIAKLSERQLRRKFLHGVGVSPKTFCRTIRFQSVLQAVRLDPERDPLSIALDCGYYDQSHFIHEFNSCYGLSPTEFLGRTFL